MPARVIMVTVLITLSCIGLILILWVALTNPRHVEGKLLDAVAYSPFDNQCIEVSARFDKERVLVFTKNAAIQIRENLVISQNSLISMVLVDKNIDNPKKIRVIETRQKYFVDLNIIDKDCSR